MERFFKLRDHGTTVVTEFIAGITTFLAMAYIVFVNPSILSQTGMPSQAVFLATLFAAASSTLVMGLFANVPYALAPGMGLNAFFTFTVCFGLGFTWQEALAMVFLCGIFNILITVTKIRKLLIVSIPESLQHAISAGIGVFIAYIGVKNAGFLNFTASGSSILSVNGGPASATQYAGGVTNVVADSGIVPALVNFTQPSAILALIGLAITIILMVRQVKGALLLGIVITTALASPMGLIDLSSANLAQNSLGNAFGELGQTFLVIFRPEGLPALFADWSRLPLVLMTIFAFSLSDVFDTIGTFVGDSIGTLVGALFGTSNTTTYVESAAGIGVGGRTGLTSVVTALLFLATMFIAPFVSLVPSVATAPALIIVGVLMMASFSDLNWTDFAEAVPAFFSSIFMGFSYSISYGIAAGFITYAIVKVTQGKAKEIHALLWVSIALFVLNFIILAVI